VAVRPFQTEALSLGPLEQCADETEKGRWGIFPGGARLPWCFVVPGSRVPGLQPSTSGPFVRPGRGLRAPDKGGMAGSASLYK